MNTTDPAPSAPRILLVDDNVDASLILSMSLRLEGFAVERSTSGQAALEQTPSWQPQAILLDISMPGMDGYETCRQLRKQTGGQGVVIIALTGYGRAEDHSWSQEAGFDWHLIKPVDLTRLTILLKELIAQKRADAA